MWPITLLESADFVVGQIHMQRAEGLIQLVRRGNADDRRGHHGIAQQPSQGHLRARHSPLAGYRAEDCRHAAVGLLGTGVEAVTEGIVGGSAGGGVPLARELAAREWAPRQHPQTAVAAQRKHLPLLFAVEDRKSTRLNS